MERDRRDPKPPRTSKISIEEDNAREESDRADYESDEDVTENGFDVELESRRWSDATG
jgi:hypothetical protein